MPASQARIKFDDNVKDVQRLLEIHEELSPNKGEPGRRYGLKVLNKSAIVLITAFWEAYCEDLSEEALDLIIKKSQQPDKLPTKLKKIVAKNIKGELNELACWELAGDGWKNVLLKNWQSVLNIWTRNWHSPNSENVLKLFSDTLGLENITDAWKWKRASVERNIKLLDNFVNMRHQIAHRGSTSEGPTKKDVQDYLDHVTTLVGKTGGRVDRHIKKSLALKLLKKKTI